MACEAQIISSDGKAKFETPLFISGGTMRYELYKDKGFPKDVTVSWTSDTGTHIVWPKDPEINSITNGDGKELSTEEIEEKLTREHGNVFLTLTEGQRVNFNHNNGNGGEKEIMTIRDVKPEI